MQKEKEVKGMIRLLESTAKMAKEASLTGSLKEGNKAAVRQYNSVLKRLEENHIVPEGLFSPLKEDTSFDEIGVACTQLASYLHEEEPREEAKKSQQSFPIDIGDIVNIGGDFEDIGRMIRDAMSSVFAQKEEEEEEEIKQEKESVKEKEESAEEEEDLPDLDEVESQFSELGSQLQVMAERIRREALSPEEKKELADKMNRLGARYAELAEQRAKVRLNLAESVNSE